MTAVASLPPRPVRLFKDDTGGPCAWRLEVRSFDQVGLLFKLCERLTSHGIDIRSANITTKDGIVLNTFELTASRPSDLTDSNEWCQELEDFVARISASKSAGQDPRAISKRLSVNPDLLSVATFEAISAPQANMLSEVEKAPLELRYRFVIGGINQAGLLTYTALVLYRSGFSVQNARISTCEGHVSDTFELSTTSAKSAHLLGSYFDLPNRSRMAPVPLPFHVTKLDDNVEELMRMWGRPCDRRTPYGESPISSPAGSGRPWSRGCAFLSSASFDAKSKESNEEDLLKGSVRAKASRSRSASDLQESMEPSTMDSSSRAPLPPGRRASRVYRNGAASKQRSLSAPASGDSSPTGQLGIGGNGARKNARQMVVNFANGDVYIGNCLMFECGMKRHGIGSYVYSSSNSSFREYRGQWREDQKYGYGVLFYRNGGVYVGQWEANKRHGLGVLFDHSDANSHAAHAMPSFRYEGQWQDDVPHGLGAEEDRMSSFFGHFERGKRHGRGVLMRSNSSTIMGVNGCEVQDSNSRLTPLLEALVDEMGLAAAGPSGTAKPSSQPASQPTSPVFRMVELQESDNPDSPTSCVPTTRMRPGGHGNDHSSPRGGDTATFTAFTLTASPSTPSLATPVVGAGRTLVANAQGRGLAVLATPYSDFGTPLVGAGGIRRPEVGHGFDGSRRDIASPTSESVETPMLPAAGHVGLHQASLPTPLAQRRSLATPVSYRMPPHARHDATPRDEGPELLELPSASPWQRDGFLLPEQAAPSPVGGQWSARDSWGPLACGPRSRTTDFIERRIEGFSPRDSASTIRVRTPLLWSEDELAAFIRCLGVQTDVCDRVRQRAFKGVTHLLEMSNSELREDLGLLNPGERIVVRQSLKRLLAADRREHDSRGHKFCDILGDSVLSHYIIPLKELTLVEKIAQGGYGTVFRGVLAPASTSIGPKREVAAKEMKGERRERLYELLKEARVMASLSNENICTFIGVCSEASSNRNYVLYELMDCSLFDLVHRPTKLRWRGEMSVSLSVSLARGICAGIAYIHAKKLVHADLKSSNILIDYTTSWTLIPRICDFGHAAVRYYSSPHHRCGTPHWAGPEVLRGEALGPAADIYSFGVIVWEMLTQNLPHKGLSFGQVLAAVGWAGFCVDLGSLPEVPEELRLLLRSCLTFTPSGRPDCVEVQRRLRHIPVSVQAAERQVSTPDMAALIPSGENSSKEALRA